MGWRLRLSDKTVRKFAELPTYFQRQKCSPGNVVSGSIRFMQIFAGVRWRGGVRWEWGCWKWRFLLHSFTFYIHGHTTAFRWYDCQWPWAYLKVIGPFHMKFLKNSVWYSKSYYRLLVIFLLLMVNKVVYIGNHTLAFDWCHFWWPCSTFTVQKMATFGSFGHCLPNILHTWPNDSFQVIQLSMTLGISQGHWTLSHQISQKRCVIRQKLL